MAFGKRKNQEYETLAPSPKNNAARDYSTISSNGKVEREKIENEVAPKLPAPEAKKNDAPPVLTEAIAPEETSHSIRQKQEREGKKSQRNEKLLQSDDWISRNGHALTFAGIYLFTIFVFFRPYELIPGLGFLQSGAMVIALATLLIYVPTQFATEGSLTILSPEIKCVVVLVFLSLTTMPIAKDPPMAWETFNDPFIKAVLMFIIMVNVVRTRRRLKSLLWLSFGISIYISMMALILYSRGEFKTEGYRVSIELSGLFNNPNDLAMHLVTMMPLTIALALASKNFLLKLFYLGLTVLFLAAMLVSFSRGGFLGLIAASAVMVWKFGRDQRLKYTLFSVIGGGIFILLAPGNYGLRLLSIFIPSLDPNGSADARREGLMRSIVVTARNPWGIGIGNSPIFGIHSLQTHNAYTQVSSELGLLGLAAYVIFMVSPFRKLGAIEQTLYANGERDWFYYLSIGLQGSLIAYMVSSFFGSVAYLWYVYYLVAYAVAFRRVYMIEKGLKNEVAAATLRDKIAAFRQLRET